MTEYADLEISLYAWYRNRYRVEMRYTEPKSEVDNRLPPNTRPLVRFDFEELLKLASSPDAYGKLLGENLFTDQNVRSLLDRALTIREALDPKPLLRLRLFIDAGAPKLHELHWETLRNPQDNSSLVTSERIVFSRYLASSDRRRVTLRPQRTLRALVFIANPSDLEEWGLKPVNVEEETQRIKMGLGDIPATFINTQGKATLERLAEALREEYDILYLLAHGGMDKDNEPNLWLENDEGKVKVANGIDLVTVLEELPGLPVLAILASCQSADMRTGDNGALASLGPRFATAGVSTVIAMQGNISMKTVGMFMPILFKELMRDGQIDRAMAVARQAVHQQMDWWMPTLFTRLNSGCIWYTSGFGAETEKFEKWKALIGRIGDGECTPILGPGLAETWLGSRQDIARRWAEQNSYPLAPLDRENLPQVAQYLAIQQDSEVPAREFRNDLRERILKKYADARAELVDKELFDLLAQVAKLQCEGNPDDPHTILACLPFKIYINTNPDNLLVEALKAQNKKPVEELCRWNRFTEKLPAKIPQNYEPEENTPLVYYLFGNIEYPKSLVLTEDNFFDFLIGVSKNQDLMPEMVRSAFAASLLLFLGFRLDDWVFRVLLRSIITRGGASLLSDYAHVAVQITPEGESVMLPARAQRYLQTYFQKGSTSILSSIYWGNVQDFVTDLRQHWIARPK